MVSPLQDLRLAFKKAFTDYYFTLRSPGIADPTSAFATCTEYLNALEMQLGVKDFMYRLDDETTHFIGDVEQEMIRKVRRNPSLGFELDSAFSEDLEERVRECFEHALDQLLPPEEIEEDE